MNDAYRKDPCTRCDGLQRKIDNLRNKVSDLEEGVAKKKKKSDRTKTIKRFVHNWWGVPFGLAGLALAIFIGACAVNGNQPCPTETVVIDDYVTKHYGTRRLLLENQTTKEKRTIRHYDEGRKKGDRFRMDWCNR